MDSQLLVTWENKFENGPSTLCRCCSVLTSMSLFVCFCKRCIRFIFERLLLGISSCCYTPFLFYKNYINFSEPHGFLFSRAILDKFLATPTSKYAFKLLFTMWGSISHSLLGLATDIFLYSKIFCVKSQPGDSYKKDSYKKGTRLFFYKQLVFLVSTQVA